MSDDPLIFVEVALTNEVPGSIHDVIAEHREELDPHQASCAIFYSISNCQKGLRGIPFGNYLIKRVVGLLQEELPQLETFATLSPLPGFAKWLSGQSGLEAEDLTGTVFGPWLRSIWLRPSTSQACRLIRSRGSTLAMARASRQSMPEPTCRPMAWRSRMASWSTTFMT